MECSFAPKIFYVCVHLLSWGKWVKKQNGVWDYYPIYFGLLGFFLGQSGLIWFVRMASKNLVASS